MIPHDTSAEDDFGFEFGAMASGCEIRIVGLPRHKAAPLALAAIEEVRRIESKYSRYQADSVITRINACAGRGNAVEVDDETAGLLAFADRLFDASDGLFDISSGSLRKAWDFRAGVLPTQQTLDALVPLVGWSQIEWNGRSIMLPRPGMEIDFGGFGKEYAADRAATLLQQRGVACGMVNLGGDIRVIGPRPGDLPWQLGVQDPRAPTRVLSRLALLRGGLATSGDYERFFEHAGKRYCHVLDPRTGWPAQGWRSVSVIAPACLAAGALTTVAMLKGADAIAFLDRQQVAYLAIDADGVLHQRQPVEAH